MIAFLITFAVVVGLAYAIRHYSGRPHWAAIVLFFLGAWLGGFFAGMMLAAPEDAMRRAMMSAGVGTFVLAAPARWIGIGEQAGEK